MIQFAALFPQFLLPHCWRRAIALIILTLGLLFSTPLPSWAASDAAPDESRLLANVSIAMTSDAEAASDGAMLFEANCAGCHPKGGNIIRRGKTLKLKALTRQHVDSVEAIATLVTQGKGLMSAYADTLTPQEIQSVSEYVWAKAQSNWK